MSIAVMFLIIGTALIAVEILVLQFSVFWFLFLGFGALITAAVAWFNPAISFTVASGIFLLASLLVFAVLLKPLQRWQQKPAPIAGNDAIGQRAEVLVAVTANRGGKVSWSGSDWDAELADGETELQVGDTAIIRRLEGIRLIVGAAGK